MSEDIKELVKRLRAFCTETHAINGRTILTVASVRDVHAAADALEALVKERDELAMEANTLIKTKNGLAELSAQKETRAEAAEAERDRLKNAIRLIASYGDGAGCNPASFTEIAREALEAKE